MLKAYKSKEIQTNQSGIVSLIIVAILAIVLGLVAIGFSQLTNRELKQAGDRELNAQAFYAAESGVNDALAYLQDPGAAPLSGCNDWQTGPNSAVAKQYFADSLSGTAKYSCVIIETTKIPNLQYSLRPGQSVTVKINQSTLDKLYFGWENQGQTNTGLALDSTFGRLPQESDPRFDPSVNPLTVNKVTGVLRAGIYAIKNTDTLVSNDGLSGLSRNYFMYPNTAAGSPNSISFAAGGYNPNSPGGGAVAPNGSFVHGNCKTGNTDPNTSSASTGRFCKSVVTNLSGISPSTTYYVQLTALYTAMNITLWGQNSGSAPITFDGTQGNIDITGKGTDVLQRVRARVDLSRDYQYPDFALQSMKALCKGFEVDVPTSGNYGSNINNSVMPNPDSSCAAPTTTAGPASGGGGDKPPH